MFTDPTEIHAARAGAGLHRLIALLPCVVVAAAASTAAAESISFDHCESKGDWFVWRSVHRPLGVAWKDPYRLKLDSRKGDYQENTTVIVVDDASSTSVAVMRRLAGPSETAASLIDRLAPAGSRGEAVKFAGVDFQGIALAAASKGRPAEHVIVRVDDGELTLVSLSAIRKPRESLQQLLDRVGQRVRVSLKESQANRRQSDDDSIEPREADWAAAETAARAFVLAMLTQDPAGASEVMLDHPDAKILFQGSGPPPEVVAMMKELVPKAEIHRCEVGENLQLPGGSRRTLTDADVNRQELQLMPEINGEPMNPPLSVVNQNGTWKVDPRPLIAARRAAFGR
ncbi:hypothetical protein Pla123a_35230 [Posidoniimonas polymericola]|uniref:Uncharacterized protein n=1 Tax=Posidoniimonas polymericola TaxID=2528002 RepID=A0A5C5YGS2_9BACT|nr:hypothetical protein [Posidoniimonas polymericola]TWT73635.1 hypothetical protein Pla123a_35230 [Posidoniimonas polymericola]